MYYLVNLKKLINEIYQYSQNFFQYLHTSKRIESDEIIKSLKRKSGKTITHFF